MSREQVLATADRDRSQARGLVKRKRLVQAQGVLENLIQLLRDSLDSDPEGSSRPELARALADVYGMLGGVHWRMGDLDGAAQAYGAGLEIERDPRFMIAESYNLTNSIVLSILSDARQLESLIPVVQAAAETVRNQLDGERRDQWWAWADYGLLCLLLNNNEESIRAYEQFERCGAGPSDHQSVARVLRLLAGAILDVDIDRGKALDEQAEIIGERIPAG